MKIFLGILFTLGMFFLEFVLFAIFVDYNSFLAGFLPFLVFIFWYFSMSPVNTNIKFSKNYIIVFIIILLLILLILASNDVSLHTIEKLNLLLIIVALIITIVLYIFHKRISLKKEENIEKRVEEGKEL